MRFMPATKGIRSFTAPPFKAGYEGKNPSPKLLCENLLLVGDDRLLVVQDELLAARVGHVLGCSFVLFRDVYLRRTVKFQQKHRLERGLLCRQVGGEAAQKPLHVLPAPAGLFLPDVRGRMLSSCRHEFAPCGSVLTRLARVAVPG